MNIVGSIASQEILCGGSLRRSFGHAPAQRRHLPPEERLRDAELAPLEQAKAAVDQELLLVILALRHRSPLHRVPGCEQHCRVFPCSPTPGAKRLDLRPTWTTTAPTPELFPPMRRRPSEARSLSSLSEDDNK